MNSVTAPTRLKLTCSVDCSDNSKLCHIGEEIFRESDLKKITIPREVEILDDSCFFSEIFARELENELLSSVLKSQMSEKIDNSNVIDRIILKLLLLL